jgi:hypothetical protein
MKQRNTLKILAFLCLASITAAGFCSCGSHHHDSGAPTDTPEEIIFDGKTDLPAGWFQAGDPDLAKLGDRWFMFFTSITFSGGAPVMKLHILAATLPPGENLNSAVSNWTILTDNAGAPIPVISPATGQDWDNEAIETANYVRGYDNTRGEWVERIYYTGWRNHPGNDGILYTSDDLKEYKIGCAEWNGVYWQKHPSNPLISGTHTWDQFYGYSLIGDLAVHYEPGAGDNGAGGTWHIWYQANSNTPTFSVVTAHANSTDGINWPETNQERMPVTGPYSSALVPAGPYYQDMEKIGGIYYFVGWIPDPDNALLEGLYAVSSTTPDASNPSVDFKDWHPLVYEQNGTYWHDSASDPSGQNGLFGSTLKQDESGLWLFYMGVSYRDGGYWGSIGRKRITNYPP